MMVQEPGMTSEQRTLAGRIDAVGWGVFFLWIGIALFADAGWGIALIGVGAILVGAQAWRAIAGVRVERFAVTIGVLFVIAGLWNLLGLRIDIVPLMFIAAGIAILASTWRTRHGHAGGAGLPPPAHPRAP